jgi:hypothetical protein
LVFPVLGPIRSRQKIANPPVSSLMLYPNLVIDALRDQRENFAQFEATWRADISHFATLLERLGQMSSGDVRSLVGTVAPGAVPSAELERVSGVVVPFNLAWRTHEEARRWAIEALRDRVTFAADGSQLLPGREVSMPVAAVQVAWFENPHTSEGSYRKEARFSIVSPGELLRGAEGNTAESIVGFRRFKMEIEALRSFVEDKRGWQQRNERTPVGFFDGTLMMSFAQPQTRIQGGYIDAITQLVKLSRDAHVPIVGFVDQSYARDLIKLLDVVDGGGKNRSPYDAQLLHAKLQDHRPRLANWGDRTIFFDCVREGLSGDFIDERGEPLVGFVYLQTTGEGLPARLDLPGWIYEAGLLDDVVDAVRAECVGGLGYPYAIETADAAAVITARDRARFLRTIQGFAERENIGFGVSRKAVSKLRRR